MTARLSPQREAETAAELREALIGFCLVALPNEVGFEKAGRLADRFEAAVRAESATGRDELKQRVTRAIYALPSPSPSSSEHHRSGWDVGLEASVDAARTALDGEVTS